MDWLTKIKIALALGKTVMSGKTAKTLEKIEGGIEIAEKVKEILPKKRKK